MEKNGDLYRLDRVSDESEDIFAGYDSNAVIAAMQAMAGRWNDIDVESFKAHIYRVSCP